ncbi:MAG TPA: glycosyltransferase [Solirubrobacteraceae bacterium]|nr:glycosyltransferase [Solirubrobacteraceae bacterium]
MILFLHNRYRVPGGEERVVHDLAWLVREHLGEDADVLERDSAALGRARATAGLLAGGLDPAEVAAAVRRTRARVVHAHNVNPSLGWRALAAAREAGARVVLHLHNYRLVCAVGTCFNSRGEDCIRCQGRDTRPGVRLNCRGSAPEAVVYAAALALWQRRIVEHADAIVVPSAFGLERLRALRAPLGDTPVHVVAQVQRAFAAESAAADGKHALVAARLSREKGVDLAVDACERAGLPLVVAGDGPDAEAVRARAGDRVRFVGQVSAAEVADLRARAALQLVPSRCSEVMPLAAVEAVAAGVPLVATDMGGLPELVGEAAALVPRDDAVELAAAALARYGDAAAGERGLRRVRELSAPEAVAARLAAVYS